MSILSENVKKRLEELRTSFTADLPERHRAIVAASELFFAHGEDEKNAWALRNHAHKLAGAAATFGYGDLTRLGKSLEAIVDVVLDEARAPTDDENSAIRRLCAEIEAEIHGIHGD